MIRKQEIDWFYQKGASYIYPDAWEKYLAPIPENEHHDLVSAYYKRLTSDNQSTRLEAAKAWSIWEASTSRLLPNNNSLHQFDNPKVADSFARIECHYFKNGGFFESDEWILENVAAIQDLPSVIIQGRYDVVCPMETAWELSQSWPEANFIVVQDAGHSANEPGIVNELIKATDNF